MHSVTSAVRDGFYQGNAMSTSGTIIHRVTKAACHWLETDLPIGKKVYEYTGCTYGCVSEDGVAVTDEPDKTPFYEIPAGAVRWDT